MDQGSFEKEMRVRGDLHTNTIHYEAFGDSGQADLSASLQMQFVLNQEGDAYIKKKRFSPSFHLSPGGVLRRSL